ncbi:hypothetical protein DKG77_07180 [Flagellimonas aquimarina]|uniref:DUF1648 domain-containing protein n=1 Tax=Flagellimonas aquimarina TaxID=2201895 RepID=A0A316KY98_9FLAO|nr:DUF1648 domain-containing protein [Allomuricauda koreensis]PWL38068.1 hypothetical protein DKG77_07180 [Allomuricauda koreensis]
MNILRKKPKIEVKPTTTDKKLVLIGWVIVILNFVVVLLFYFDLPETIPVHFNLKGEINGFGSKSILWIIPSISASIYMAMSILVLKMKPYYMNYPVKVTEKNAKELYALGIRMLTVMNLTTVIIFLITTLIFVFKIKGIFDTIDTETLIGLWIAIALLPFIYVFKMFNVSKQ